MTLWHRFILIGALTILALAPVSRGAKEDSLDAKVSAFLEGMRFQWRDMNVSRVDGELLYDIIVRNRYTRALEIGTSTGHSGVWIAWALSKTGGQLVTIEIDKSRHDKAAANFERAGLSDIIDARLADAHELVKQLNGPFDFIFIDAEKDGYTSYAQALIPKLETGGCIAAHNVDRPRPGSRGRYGRGMGTAAYYDFMTGLPDFETSVLEESRSGLAVSYKKKQLSAAKTGTDAGRHRSHPLVRRPGPRTAPSQTKLRHPEPEVKGRRSPDRSML